MLSLLAASPHGMFAALLAENEAPGAPALDPTALLGLLALMLAAAKAMGLIARRIGQPPLLGEMLAGVLLGKSLLGVVDMHDEALRVIADFGFTLFLFQVGLELDYRRFVRVLNQATPVALAGVFLPGLFGYGICRGLGLEIHACLGIAAAVSATSLGVTARLLSDLNRLEDLESEVILGAAILGNVFGLLMLKVAGDLAKGVDVTLVGMAINSALAYGFLLLVLGVGAYVAPPLFHIAHKLQPRGAPTGLAVVLALGLAWLAARAGAAQAVGAFLAGLLIAQQKQAEQIREEVVPLESVLVSIAFVFLGAQIDLRVLNPLSPHGSQALTLGLAVTATTIGGKFLAGFAAPRSVGDRRVIGVGMVAHGDMGLFFAQIALSAGVLNQTQFSALALMVLTTTFGALFVLPMLYPARSAPLGRAGAPDPRALAPGSVPTSPEARTRIKRKRR